MISHSSKSKQKTSRTLRQAENEIKSQKLKTKEAMLK